MFRRMNNLYRSIPSHNPMWHMERKHKFFHINVATTEEAEWARLRCLASFHGPALDKMREFLSYPKYNTLLLDYSKFTAPHATVTIQLDDIRTGELIRKIQRYFDFELNVELYKQWLARNV